MGKTLIALGVVLIFIGLMTYLRLPGDIYIKKEHFTFVFPLASCILASIILSIIFYLLK